MENSRVAFSLAALFLISIVTPTSSFAHQGGHGNEVMWEVCAAKQIDSQCAFTDHEGGLHKGSCQEMADHLVCVRNQPIIHPAGTEPQTSKQAADSGAKKGGPENDVVLACILVLAGALLTLIHFTKRGTKNRSQ